MSFILLIKLKLFKKQNHLFNKASANPTLAKMSNF